MHPPPLDTRPSCCPCLTVVVAARGGVPLAPAGTLALEGALAVGMERSGSSPSHLLASFLVGTSCSTPPGDSAQRLAL